MPLPDATYDGEEPINVGWGKDLTIAELAGVIAEIVGYTGDSVRHKQAGWHATQASGRGKAGSLGWNRACGCATGIASTYRWFLQHRATGARGETAHGD